MERNESTIPCTHLLINKTRHPLTMFVEVPLGMMAWVGVIAIQALLLKVIIPTRAQRRKSHVGELEQLSLEGTRTLHAISEKEEYCQDDVGIYDASAPAAEDLFDDDETPLQSPCVPVFGYCNEQSLDEEPRQIQQLLNQTGSELVVGSPQECLSMSFFERLAKEQLQEQQYQESAASAGEDETTLRPMPANAH